MTDQDTWQVPGPAGERIAILEKRIASLERAVHVYRDRLDRVSGRVSDLERDTPQARQAQAELDATLADNAEAGYGDYHGRDCQCPYCATDEDVTR